MNKIFLFLFLFLFKNSLYAASCCGGGSSSSLILIGDNIQEYTLGISYRNDLGQTDNLGWASFHTDNVTDEQKAISFQWQRQLSERYQLAFKTSLVEKKIEKQNRREVTTGFGDVDIQGTFEFLPEYTYSAWKPRGFLYSKLSVPMSKSLYDSRSSIYSDVRGSGLYSISIGSFFIKHITDLTLKIAFEEQHLIGKSFSQTTLMDYDKIIVPIGVSFGFDPRPISIGAGSTWSYQSPKKFKGQISGTSDKEYFWEFNTFINWIISRTNTLGLGYSDSTLIGKNVNSSLYRSFSLTYTNSVPL